MTAQCDSPIRIAAQSRRRLGNDVSAEIVIGDPNGAV
jgi:hypothetical protein